MKDPPRPTAWVRQPVSSPTVEKHDPLRDRETTLRVRVRRATAASAAAVLAVGGSTLAMIDAVDPHASAPVAWAVVFFGAAQASAVSLVLALLQVAAMGAQAGTPADVALLCRRNASAVGFALLAMFAVGAALPGQTAAWRIIVGPAVAVIALASLVRARSLARALDRHASRALRSPLTDAAVLVGRAVDTPGSGGWERPVAPLVCTMLIAMTGAFAWDSLDHGSLAEALVAAAVEAGLMIAGFVLLGGALGLRASGPRRRA